MNIETRLTKLETAATNIPRTVAQLIRDHDARVPALCDERAWFANLSADELALLCDEADRQFPQLDFSRFSDEELDRVFDLDAAEIGQLIAGDYSPLGRAS